MQKPQPLFAKEVPLHHQIYEVLRAEITDGLYVGQAGFPGEAELAARFDVSMATSRMVLQRLAAEGLIARGRGRRPEAVFVPHQDAVTPLTANIDLFTFKLLGTAEVVAPWAACRTFGLPAGSIMWRSIRLRLVDEEPHSVTCSYEPVEIGRLHDAKTAEIEPLPRMLETIGLPIVFVECLVGVRRPPVEVSAALDLIVWDKVLETALTSFTHGDRPVDYSLVYFRSNLQHSLATVALGTGAGAL